MFGIFTWFTHLVLGSCEHWPDREANLGRFYIRTETPPKCVHYRSPCSVACNTYSLKRSHKNVNRPEKPETKRSSFSPETVGCNNGGVT